MRRQGPGVRRREHAILQQVVLRVRPVVRDLLARVVAEDVRLSLRSEERSARGREALGFGGALVLAPAHRGHEPVHLAAVAIDDGGLLIVRAALLVLGRAVVRARAMSEHPVRYADLRRAVGSHRDPVRAGERPEVVIEGAILLHDDDDVIDRPGRTGRDGGSTDCARAGVVRRRGVRREGARGGNDAEQDDRQQCASRSHPCQREFPSPKHARTIPSGWGRRYSHRKRGLRSPNGIRTRVSTLRGWCPRPLDDGTGSGRSSCMHGDLAGAECTKGEGSRPLGILLPCSMPQPPGVAPAGR